MEVEGKPAEGSADDGWSLNTGGVGRFWFWFWFCCNEVEEFGDSERLGSLPSSGIVEGVFAGAARQRREEEVTVSELAAG